MKINKWLGLFGLSLTLLAGGVSAELKAGRDYKPLAAQQAVETGAKVEVIEFFW